MDGLHAGSTRALAILIGAALAVTLYARLRPGFRLRIIDKWVGDRLILRFEIEATSAVYALVESAYAEVEEKPKGSWLPVESAYAEVEEKPLAKGSWLPHRVEFSEKEETAIFDRKIDDKETTNRIYPGEVMAVERVYDFPADGTVVQVGLQVKLRRRRKLLFFPEHRQTTTAYFVKPSKPAN